MSKLKDYLDKAKIDTRQLLARSKRIERLSREDRSIRLAKKAVAGGKPTDAHKELAAKKPSSGRKLSRPTLDKALAGGKLTKAAKKRVTRAVNAVLAPKKKGEAKVADLF
jgi:hypothetical protein